MLHFGQIAQIICFNYILLCSLLIKLIYTHTHTQRYILSLTHTHTHTVMWKPMCSHARIHSHTHTHTHTRKHPPTHARTHMHAHTFTHTHTHWHAHTHKYTHTQTHRPVTVGVASAPWVVVEVILGMGMVRITPALVPTHSRSLHTSSAVILRHAALCWRMMSSAAAHRNKYTVTTVIRRCTQKQVHSDNCHPPLHTETSTQSQALGLCHWIMSSAATYVNKYITTGLLPCTST